MNKKTFCLFCLLFVISIILFFNTKSYAENLDEIVNYVVTVEPRMNDGTLDIIYEITWKVLDSQTEGPLEWVQIGTPNSYFDTPTALTKNIRNISKYNGSYVRLVFDRKYYAGEQITFKYKIHQSYMYKISGKKCKYSFTPAWFTDAKINNMTVKWNKDDVKSSNSKSKEGNYLVWNKTNMDNGEKLKVDVNYDKSAFGYLDEYKQSKNVSNGMGSYGFIIFMFIIIAIISIFISAMGGGYYGHRGFYGGYYGGGYYRSSCVRSSCACARSSCACACACAGSGRAGCSKKDFYGTKLNSNKLKKVLN